MVTIYYLYVEPCHHIYGRKRTVKIKSELNRIEKYTILWILHREIALGRSRTKME